MRRPSRFVPSPAMIVACVALFVALGGTGYAVAQGWVGTRAIKQGAVRTSDIHRGAVRSKDVRDRSLTGRDIKDGSLTRRDLKGKLRARPGEDGSDGEDGFDGQDGIDGQDGEDGDQGPTGVADLKLVTADGTGTVAAVCPDDTLPVSGGAQTPGNEARLLASHVQGPSGDTNWAWTARARNSEGDAPVTAYVLCSDDVKSITAASTP